MQLLTALLNVPWTVAGFMAALISFPTGVSCAMRPLAVIFNVRSFWWYAWLPRQKGVRGMAVGNIVLLSSKILHGDLEHELVHVRQFQKEPLIFPALNLIETFRKGYRNNKYEAEAYRIAGNPYLGDEKN